MSEASTPNGRSSKCQSDYGEEIPGNPVLRENLGVRAYRRDEKLTLIFELPDRSLIANINLAEVPPPSRAIESIEVWAWRTTYGVDELTARIASWCKQGSEILPQESPLRRTFITCGYSDELIRWVTLNIRRHCSEAERRLFVTVSEYRAEQKRRQAREEESRRAEEDLISKVKIGKPPQPPYGKEITDQRLKAFGVRAYRKNWLKRRRVTFVFTLGLVSEVAIAVELPPGYWSGRRLTGDFIISMLAAIGHTLQSGIPMNGVSAPTWRIAFRESGYTDDILRQVTTEIAKKQELEKRGRLEERQSELAKEKSDREQAAKPRAVEGATTEQDQERAMEQAEQRRLIKQLAWWYAVCWVIVTAWIFFLGGPYGHGHIHWYGGYINDPLYYSWIPRDCTLPSHFWWDSFKIAGISWFATTFVYALLVRRIEASRSNPNPSERR